MQTFSIDLLISLSILISQPQEYPITAKPFIRIDPSYDIAWLMKNQDCSDTIFPIQRKSNDSKSNEIQTGQNGLREHCYFY